MPVTFHVNGETVCHDGPTDRRLLAILREDLALTGAKPGCGIGRCGACMVWLDGEPVNACLVMAWQLDGRRVTTIESVAADPRSAPLRDTLAACGAVQCGYCNAGLVMTLAWLHARPTLPDRAEAAASLCGNLCRCTGYGGVSRAIETLFPASG